MSLRRHVVVPRELVVIFLIAVAGILFYLFAFKAYYIVNEQEMAVVTRFGRYYKEVGPGLHFKLPLGIDNAEKVPIRQQREEFGYRSVGTDGASTRYSDNPFGEESLMVTGDLNAAEIEWSVQYRVDDPRAFLFNMRNPRETLRAAVESVMREVIGDRNVDEVITIGREEIRNVSREKLQALMDDYKIGIRIDGVELQASNPPPPVAPAFNEVNQAQQQRERMINEARADYNRDIPRIGGQALQKIEAARGYAAERVNRAQGDANRFNALLTEYLNAPEATRQRIYLETMQTVLPRMGRKIVIDSDARQVLPLLQLGDGAPLITPEEAKR